MQIVPGGGLLKRGIDRGWTRSAPETPLRQARDNHRKFRAAASGNNTLPLCNISAREFIPMPDPMGFGDCTESRQVIPVSFEGGNRRYRTR